MATLSWYKNDASALLHDQAFSFTSQTQLVRWINDARRSLARRTGCVRRLVTGQSAYGASAQPGQAIPGAVQPGSLPGANNNAVSSASTNSFTTIPGVERYPYQGFVNPFLRAQYAGVQAVIDTIACSVKWGGGVNGSPRPSLAWMPFEDLQAYARAYATLTQSYPYYWSIYNDGENGEIWMFPVPSFAMEIELDTFCVPNDLYTDDDYDAIPDAFSTGVKFLAASLAYLTSRRYAQAQAMENLFSDSIGVTRVAVDMGKTPNFYTASL